MLLSSMKMWLLVGQKKKRGPKKLSQYIALSSNMKKDSSMYNI